jgi:hypothetical protein
VILPWINDLPDPILQEQSGESDVRLWPASILVAGIMLSGCTGSLDSIWGYGAGGYYPSSPYGSPYPEFGYTTLYEPGWGGYGRHDRDWHDHSDWSRHNGDWHQGQPHVWAGQPGGGGHPVNLTPPPAPPSHAPDAQTQQFMNALGFKPNR